MDFSQFMISPGAGGYKTGADVTKTDKVRTVDRQTIIKARGRYKHLKEMKSFYETQGELTQITPQLIPEKQSVLPAPGKDNNLLPQEQNKEKTIEKFRKNEKAMEAFNGMTQEEQKEFLSLLEKNTGGSTTRETALIKLLEEGKLLARDTQKNTVLHTLQEIKNQEFAPGLDGKKILEEIIQNLAEPDNIGRGNKNTDGIATLEYIQAMSYPGEYARLVAGLTGKEGKVSLTGDTVLERPTGITQDDDSNRSSIDRIYQASLMNYTYEQGSLMNYGSKLEFYDNLTDKAFIREEKDGKTTNLPINEPLCNAYLSDTFQSVLPYKNKIRGLNIDDREIRFIEKKAAENKGEMLPVKLMADDGTERTSLLEKIEGDYVYLREPVGNSGKEGSGGHIKIKREEFYKKLQACFVPAHEKTGKEQLEDIIEQIKYSEKAVKSYQNMPQREKDIFIKLAERCYSQESEETMPELIRFLEKGTLSDKDSRGNTLLDNLADISEHNKDTFFLRRIIGNTGNPDRIKNLIATDSRLAELEYNNILNNPSEYVRILTGVAGEKREVTLQNGDVLKLPGNLTGKNPSLFYQASVDEYIKNNQASEEKKRQDILNQVHGDEKALEKFEDMTDKDREKFLTLAGKTYKNGIRIMNSELIPGSGRELIGLLAGGKLSLKDSMGSTLLDNLKGLAEQDFAEGLTSEEIFNETLLNIDNPDRIHQGSKGTCTVTTLEYINAKNHPAEYVRIMSGLAGKSGKIILRNGDTLERYEGSVRDDKSGRTVPDRIYQTSMMEYANGPLFYDNEEASGKHYQIIKHSDGKEEKIYRHEGLDSDEFNKALNAALPYESKVRKNENRDVSEKEIKDILSEGYPAFVSLSWGMDNEIKGTKSFHEMVVEKMEGDYVYLRNPWGDKETGGKGNEELNEALREAILQEKTGKSGGHIKMTKDEFFRKLQDYNMPGKIIIENLIKETEDGENAYSNLTEEEKGNFLKMASNDNYRSSLIKLLSKGKLSDKDSEGKILLQNLMELQAGENKYTDVLLPQIGYADVFKPENMSPAEELQYNNLANNPSEYIRIMTGLTGEKGEATLQNGKILKRIDDSDFYSTYKASIGNYINNSLTAEEKKNDIIKTMEKNTRALEAFKIMSQEEKEEFLNLAVKDYTCGIKIMAGEIPPKINENLLKLLEEGKLSNKGKDGNTLLHNIYLMSEQEFAEGLQSKEIIDETLKVLASPDNINTGNRYSLDAASSLEYFNAVSYSAEFAKIISGLTGKEGKVLMPDGKLLERSEGTIKEDGSRRSHIDKIYQASMMNFMYQEGSMMMTDTRSEFYDNSADRAYTQTEEGRKPVDSDLWPPCNLYLAAPIEALLNRQVGLGMFKNNEKDIQYFESLSDKTRKKGDFITIRLGENQFSRIMVLEKLDGEYAYLKNPGGGRQKMEKSEFYNELSNYFV